MAAKDFSVAASNREIVGHPTYTLSTQKPNLMLTETGRFSERRIVGASCGRVFQNAAGVFGINDKLERFHKSNCSGNVRIRPRSSLEISNRVIYYGSITSYWVARYRSRSRFSDYIQRGISLLLCSSVPECRGGVSPCIRTGDIHNEYRQVNSHGRKFVRERNRRGDTPLTGTG